MKFYCVLFISIVLQASLCNASNVCKSPISPIPTNRHSHNTRTRVHTYATTPGTWTFGQKQLTTAFKQTKPLDSRPSIPSPTGDIFIPPSPDSSSTHQVTPGRTSWSGGTTNHKRKLIRPKQEQLSKKKRLAEQDLEPMSASSPSSPSSSDSDMSSPMTPRSPSSDSQSPTPSSPSSPVKPGQEDAFFCAEIEPTPENRDYTSEEWEIVQKAIMQVLKEKIIKKKSIKDRPKHTRRLERIAQEFSYQQEREKLEKQEQQAIELDQLAADIRAYEQENGDL